MTSGQALGGPPAGGRPNTIVALLPAHNEAESIAATLRALKAQTRVSDLVIVICDNCTDATAQIARADGATVWNTSGNTRKKAGALNYALRPGRGLAGHSLRPGHDLAVRDQEPGVFAVRPAQPGVSQAPQVPPVRQAVLHRPVPERRFGQPAGP